MHVFRMPPKDVAPFFDKDSQAHLHVIYVSQNCLECYGEAGVVRFVRTDCSDDSWAQVVGWAVDTLNKDLLEAQRVKNSLCPVLSQTKIY